MLKIPVYERTVERSTQGPDAYSLAGERSSALRIPSHEAEFAGMQNFGEQVTRIGERMRRADQVERYSRALVEANEGLGRIHQQIHEDPGLRDADPEEYERVYKERTSELKGRISGRLKDSETRSAFDLRFSEKEADGQLRVRNLGRERMISRGRASTDAQLDSLVNSFIRTGNVSHLAEGGSIIAAKRAAGFFTPEEAEQLGQRFGRNATVGYWERRILDAPKLAYEMLKQNPESVQALPEADRTRLLVRAKEAGERWEREDVRRTAYAELKGRFGRNLQAAVDHLENPGNYPDMDLDDRRYLMATFDGEITRDRERAERARIEGARKERRQVVDLLKTGDYDKAVALAEASENLPGEFVEHVYRVAKRGVHADATDPSLRAALTVRVHQGKATVEEIDAYRLNGLSNADADALITKAEKPERDYYRETLKYAEDKFKAQFPIKDQREKHLKWVEFVEFIDRELEASEKDKRGRLSGTEARKIVDGWLDPQIEERRFWFDREYVPFFERKEYAGDQARGKAPAREIRGIPPEDVQKIERTLLGLGAKVSPANVRQYWLNNQTEFTRAGR